MGARVEEMDAQMAGIAVVVDRALAVRLGIDRSGIALAIDGHPYGMADIRPVPVGIRACFPHGGGIGGGQRFHIRVVAAAPALHPPGNAGVHIGDHSLRPGGEGRLNVAGKPVRQRDAPGGVYRVLIGRELRLFHVANRAIVRYLAPIPMDGINRNFRAGWRGGVAARLRGIAFVHIGFLQDICVDGVGRRVFWTCLR